MRVPGTLAGERDRDVSSTVRALQCAAAMTNRPMLLLCLTMTACLDASDVVEDDAPLTRDADRGELAFGVPASAALSRRDPSHTWRFTLHGPARVAIATGPAGRGITDTVLALYRDGASRPLARNDDSGGTLWSALRRDLPAGDYRVVVRGYAGSRGRFAVRADCRGDGCAPPAMCLFGDTFRDLEAQPALVVTGRRKWTAATPLTALDQRRVVRAVQQSSHTDVTTPEEAFARVDQGEINRVDVYEPAAARTFVVLEYGAGDNSYGAYFHGLDDRLVARIHDGDLLDCAITAETCLLGRTARDLRSSPAFRSTGARHFTAPDDVRGLEAEQVVRAVQESYDVTTVAEALDRVDAGEIALAGYAHVATGAEVFAVEYGAGDSLYGAVFRGGSLDVVAAIHDGDLYGCTLFD